MIRAFFRMFDYSGRSSRWEYWSFIIGLCIIGFIGGIAFAIYQDAHGGLAPTLSDGDAAILVLAYIVVVCLPSIPLKVRRYHDFGWSGWAVLWVVVPVVNLVMELMLLFRGSLPEREAYPADFDPRPINIYNSPSAGTGAHVSSADQLARLADMHAQGVLTAQEFAAAKAKVLRQ